MNCSQTLEKIIVETVGHPEFDIRFCTANTDEAARNANIITFIKNQVSDCRQKGLVLDSLNRVIIVDQRSLSYVDMVLNGILNISSVIQTGLVRGYYKRGKYQAHLISILVLPNDGFDAVGNPSGETLGDVLHEIMHVHDDQLRRKLPEVKYRIASYLDSFWSEFTANRMGLNGYSPAWVEHEAKQILGINPINPTIWLKSPEKTV